jgi:uncharacterized RDD family membrane protein YckC
MYCAQCGSPTQQDARFCRSCGANIASTPVAVAEPELQPADPTNRPGYIASNVGSPNGTAAAVATVYAGFWLRVAAASVDLILISIVNFGIGVILGVAVAGSPSSANTVTTIAGLIGFGVGLLYYPIMESSDSQATFGKRAVGIKVTDLYGRRISFGRALGRHVAQGVCWLTLGLGYLMASFTERKQALHDMIAGTLVVRTSS